MKNREYFDRKILLFKILKNVLDSLKPINACRSNNLFITPVTNTLAGSRRITSIIRHSCLIGLSDFKILYYVLLISNSNFIFLDFL